MSWDRILSLPVLAICMVLGSASAIASTSASADEVTIVHATVAEIAIDTDALKDVFLGRQTTWSNGAHITVVIAKSGPSHDAVMQLLDKSNSQFLISWKKLVFTGKGTMPEQVDGEDALVRFVAMTPGAIGTVDRAKVTDGVKVLPLR
jgi:ABC-type phosphate transport system substrate-binding protein